MPERLEDERIALRPLTLDDADDWLAGQDEEEIRWFEFPRASVRADVVAAIQRWTASRRAGGPDHHWGIRDLESDELMGGVEIRNLGDGDCNLSYVVFPPFRRRGVATRAAQLAIDASRDAIDARRVVIKVLEGNVASLSVARRLGATPTHREPSDGGTGTFVVLELAVG